MKKFCVCLIIAILVFSICTGAYAADYNAVVNPSSVLLMNVDTGEILYEKNSTDTVFPASTTKILTALVVLDTVSDLNETVTVPADALVGIYEGDDSTLVPMLKANEQISVKNLLYGLMLVSGNDTASTLAYHTAGSEDAFAELMNQKALALNMTNSHFTNPHGVQDSDHYTTADDMAKLCKAAMENPAFMEIVSCASYTIPATNLTAERILKNSNLFLCETEELPGTEYEYATGMKTGYTPTAKGCLVSTAEKDGIRLMCLVFEDASEDQQERWFLSRDLFEYGFEFYETQEAFSPEFVDPVTEEPSDASADKERKTGVRILLTIVFILLSAACAMLAVTRIKSIRRHQQRMIKRGITPKPANSTPTFVLFAVSAIMLTAAIISALPGAANDNPVTETDINPIEQNKGFSPAKSAKSDPANWGITWETTGLSENLNPLSFGAGDDYFDLPGIAGFRSDNYRSGATYGTANVIQEYISVLWEVTTDSLTTGDGTSAWTGSGWTGQPLIVQWDDTTRNQMNLYPEKKAKTGLTEVIYATLDGNIYFLDIDDGSYTRDPVYIGMAFKGSGALDPRGYPLMYVGSGDETVTGKRPRMYVISLIDGNILYEYGYEETFSLRQDNDQWCAFDSSPLVHAESDTLIWPGENGILYTIKLNTVYDVNAGTISISPDEPVKTRYTTSRSGKDEYWYGYECSAVIVDHYLYLSENGGMFFCIDLNNMELVWAQDTGDDSNSSPVYEVVDDENGYIYTAPSLHWTANDEHWGNICIYKLNAVTGEIVWSRSYECGTVDGVSGGVQSSPLLGKVGTDIEGMIIYPIARTPNISSGLLIAFDCENGSEVWRVEMDNYTWSSPAAVYTPEGKSYIVLCDSSGAAMLIDGLTGERLDTTDIGSLVEASPAIFNDKVIVGTRGERIYALSVY